MSDTPETDNFIVSAGYVRTDHQWRTFARKLERGRNSLQDQRDLSIRMAKERERERDEAREAGWKAAMQAVWDRLPMPEYANDPMTPREVAKLIEFVRSQKEAAK